MPEIKFEPLTTVVNKYPTFRDDVINGCWKWLKGRRADDNAEGLWRVHDKLYDLREFKKTHPGGREWLTLTEGTDITEAFESYHIRSVASQVLPKYFVRDASKPRNYRFTYKDDGFYRTLKRRAAEKLESVDKSPVWKSNLILDVTLVMMFVTSVLTIRAETYNTRLFWGFVAAQFMAWLNTISHNFIHQRNNLRMYSSCIVLTGWRDWRVFHGLSHHLYPNTIADFEVSPLEPFFNFLPIHQKHPKTIIQSYIATPFVYAFIMHGAFVSRFYGYYYEKRQRIIWEELLPLFVPLTMVIFGNLAVSWENLKEIFWIWNYIMLGASFLAAVVAINAGHHGPENVHEGDEFKDLDFGIYQLAATIDRTETKSNAFSRLAYFGEHTLHHMFPSLDHSLLPQFRSVFLETCLEFQEQLRECSFYEALVAQFEQLGRTKLIRLNTKSD